ncbi:nuclear transport factor 2 family protein [Modestobacter versicolor]|uniref:Ketosteroid isomerase-like protein n=1 Tax=Modestobacter versicolor TaxID=429133 RepID=A0A323V8I2_9ACTN|nr:nuclear transport factor 2 family protein [Modestobacter versicolor]MBB3674740.1 ketosteroid isomerase-like protein [Modestobacter versicolor]PZA21102.1 nuclear transport factor 2 family protein [Modestobacter versicolor]
MTTPTAVPPTGLPARVQEFLTAHTARDADTAVRAFTPDAVVTDEGRTFRGTEELLGFLRHSGSEFSYTTELTAVERLDDEHWVAVNHLEGDFPGGVVDLAYRFTLVGDLIAELVIAPR